MIRKALQSFLVIAIAALATQFAPTAAASGNGGHHGDHYDDPEAQMWYEFAQEKAEEINLLNIRYCYGVAHKTTRAISELRSTCMVECRSAAEESRMNRIRYDIARRAKMDISKCVWDAKMELETCYEDARQQLEDAGYEKFVPYIYRPYNQTRQEIVRKQRRANGAIMGAIRCPI